MDDSRERGRTVRTALDAAAASIARGASGVWLRAGSRLGLACRGTVYLLVGYLAFRLAVAGRGRAGEPASSAGAVQAAIAPVWGRLPLVLLVAGLAAYALTQLLEAVFRPARADGPAGRWRQRAVSSWGFVLYSGFCVTTARLLAGTPAAQTARSEQRQDTGLAAGLLRTGWGRALLVVAGILVMAAGLEAARRAVRLNFRERFAGGHMARPLAIVIRVLGAFGSGARAVVFVLVGVFLVKAAVVSRGRPGQRPGRRLPLGGRLPLRCLAAGAARRRPVLLRPLLPGRGPVPRPDPRTITPQWGLAARPRARSGGTGGPGQESRAGAVREGERALSGSGLRPAACSRRPSGERGRRTWPAGGARPPPS